MQKYLLLLLGGTSTKGMNIPGSTVPTLAITKLGTGQQISVLSTSGCNLIVDIAGWFTR